MERQYIKSAYPINIQNAPIQDIISLLIEVKKEARKAGWKDLEVHWHGSIKGLRPETDEEYEKRKVLRDSFLAMSTRELVAKLQAERTCEWQLSPLEYQTLKEILDEREHVPTGKFENKAIRKLKKQYGIKSTEELLEYYQPEVSKLTKELSESC